MMENETLIWCFLLVLLYAGKSEQYACIETEECSCIQMPGEEYEMRCPKNSDSTIIIKVASSKQTASITCNSKPSWSDFKFQSIAPIEDVKLFSIQMCFLPNSTLHEIAQKVGVQPKRLRFESYQNLSSSLERRHISGFPRLERLSLNSNELTNVPGDLLQDLPELTMLELRENNVVLPVEFFEPVPKLQLLELGLNKLTHIDSKLFQSLEKLTHLGLWGNNLTSIEEHTFDKLTALNTLEMSKNKLVNLPQDIFKHLKNLTSLQMNLNNFSSLPEGLLSQNQNLTKFGLNSNLRDMTSLPSRLFSNLSSIREVQLMRNGLTHLPEDIFWGSSSLRNLTLRGNSFTTLPENIFNESRNLATLDLSLNKFSTLPDGLFKALNKLEKLELQNNNLTFISRGMFMGLTGLKEINLERNGLRSVHPTGFNPLGVLEVIRLSHNEIVFKNAVEMSAVEFGISSPLSGCRKLREIHLSHNKIDTVFSDWGFVLLDLSILDLSYNEISYIETAHLQFVSRHVEVDLRHNNISQINLQDAEVIAATQTISGTKDVMIYVDANPIICDCFLYHFLKYLDGEMHPNVQKLFHIIPGQLECAGPELNDHILVSKLKAKTLTCYNPECSGECECWSRPSDRTVIANCSYKNLSIAPAQFSAPKEFRLEIDLTGNILTEMPTFNQSGNADVTNLYLSHNRISSISVDAVPPLLETLELNNNNLTRWNTTVLEQLNNSTSLTKLTLHGNPWKCDCETREFLSFVQSNFTKIPDRLNVTCVGSTKALSKMTADDLCPVDVGMIVGISLGIAFLGLLIGTLAALYYKYQVEIKVWLFAHQLCLWFVTEEELDKDKLYDAFISFSQKDEDFVINKLVSKLEENPKPYKLCIHYRDWVPGEWITEQIAKSVQDSKRTIVVVSPNFLESIWGKMEFRAAHKQALSEGRARVIVILFGDIGPTDKLDPELQAYLNMNTYVKWGDPWFWDKLRYALPHPLKVKNNKVQKVFESHQPHIKINGDKNGLINNLPGVPATPPAVTTPPADTLKTFTSNGSINKRILITDCLRDQTNFDPQNMEIDNTANRNDYEKNIMNRQCTPV